MRRAVDRLRLSFFVGVALVPLLVSELFTGLEHLLPWWALFGLLCLAIGFLFLAAWRAELRRLRLAAGTVEGVRAVRNASAVTDLVLTVNLAAQAPQNLHTLLPVLRGVRQVYAVVGAQPGAEVDLDGRLRELVAQTGRTDVHAQVLMAVPPWDMEDESLRRLRGKLAGVQELKTPGGVVAVDVTGGTAPMSMVTYLAAAGAGLAVTYTTTDQPAAGKVPGSRQYRGMVALHDPDGVLTGLIPVEQSL